MYSYKLSLEAEEDVVRIFEYGIGQFGVFQAAKYYDMLFECFNKIASNPLMFPIDYKHNNIERYCVCGIDTIYFNIKSDVVEIITIVGRQNF